MLTRRIAHLVAAAAVGSSLFLALPSYVAASCVPPRSYDGNYHQAWVAQSPGGSVGGVWSDILNYQPYAPPGTFSYSWDMITKNANWYWAQIGNFQSGASRQVYLQYADGSSPAHAASFGAKALGQYTYYSVSYYNGQFFFYADSLVFSHYASWVPTVAILSSETTSLDVQMMGATYSPVWFTNNHIYYNSTWQSVAGSLNNPDPTHFGIAGNGSSFETWDKACSY